ncbi:hypothetical protein ES703_120000 [subsurface metagenome]
MVKDSIDLVQITLEFKQELPDDVEVGERLQLFYFPLNPDDSYFFSLTTGKTIQVKDFKMLADCFHKMAKASDEILKILESLGGEIKQ